MKTIRDNDKSKLFMLEELTRLIPDDSWLTEFNYRADEKKSEDFRLRDLGGKGSSRCWRIHRFLKTSNFQPLSPPTSALKRALPHRIGISGGGPAKK